MDKKRSIHEWFELTYAQYLTIPRSIMEAMPEEWQHRMVDLLSELDDTYKWRPEEGCYWVRLKDAKGRFTHDPLMNYRRPNFAHIETLKKEEGS